MSDRYRSQVMETDLREAICSGLFVEFCDECGNCVAQSVYLDWERRPVPAVGDMLTCSVKDAATGRNNSFSGRVRSRQYEIQRDEQGSTSVWVTVVVDLTTRARPRSKVSSTGFTTTLFSNN